MKILNLFNQKKLNHSELIRPYIIAEAGVNHEGDMNIARRLIEEAQEGGANAIKFQTYKAQLLSTKNSPVYWDITKETTTSQYKLFKKYDKFWKNEFEILKQYCDNVGIEFLSTPFDIESAKFLNELMDVFKISSSDITNKPFIEFICDFGKPIILSTGASYLNEINDAAGWIDAKSIPFALLHCILNYPTDDINANLSMIKNLQSEFPSNLIGYSDHTLPNDMKVLEIASVLGASIIEKHFTHDKALPGNDHYHAMDKSDLKLFCDNLEYIFGILGETKKQSIETEESARKEARRSLVALSRISKGETLTLEKLTWKRPAHGISPKYIDEVIGKIAQKDISEDEIIFWSSIGVKS